MCSFESFQLDLDELYTSSLLEGFVNVRMHRFKMCLLCLVSIAWSNRSNEHVYVNSYPIVRWKLLLNYIEYMSSSLQHHILFGLEGTPMWKRNFEVAMCIHFFGHKGIGWNLGSFCLFGAISFLRNERSKRRNDSSEFWRFSCNGHWDKNSVDTFICCIMQIRLFAKEKQRALVSIEIGWVSPYPVSFFF